MQKKSLKMQLVEKRWLKNEMMISSACGKKDDNEFVAAAIDVFKWNQACTRDPVNLNVENGTTYRI